MKHTLITLTALLLAPLAGLIAAEKSKPNILHIHADDHRPDGLCALGNQLRCTMKTMSLNHLSVKQCNQAA